MIDSELHPKAAYWYSRRFFAPLLVSFKPAGKFIEIWATNDTLSTVEAEFEIEVLNFLGEVDWARREHVLIPANISLRLAAPDFTEFLQIDPSRQYFRARLRKEGRVLAENRHFFCRYKHLHLETPHLDCRLKQVEAQTWQVQIKSDRFVKNLALLEPPAGVTLTENYFDLDANCEMVIAVRYLPPTQMLAADSLKWRWLS